ncbi:Protein SQS1 [Meyerozyma sp. JA9]|nr:Protein SQS1 [Meyerozyma sp. JA9]
MARGNRRNGSRRGSGAPGSSGASRGRNHKTRGRGGSNRASRRAASGGTRAGAGKYNAPELMDLDFGAIDDVNMGTGSMRSLSKRPGRNTMMQEAFLTSKHTDRSVGEPLRKRPIEFIKAKEVYDPRAILEKVTKTETEEKPEAKPEEKPDGATDITAGLRETTIAEQDRNVESNDEMEKEEEKEKEAAVEPIIEKDEPNLEKGDPNLHLEDSEQVDENLIDDTLESSVSDDNDTDDSQTDSESFFIDNSPQPIDSSSPAYVPSNDVGPNIDHDPVLTIGNVQLHTSGAGNDITALVRSSTQYDELDSVNEFSDSDSDEDAYADYIRQLNGQSSSEDSSSEESGSASDGDANVSSTDSPQIIEYGFLPEDYEFDVSQISVTNVRFGIKNQFYSRCLELTGSADDYMWVDEDDLIDFVTSKGVKEHRLESFLSYITNGMVNKPENDEEEEQEVYVSSDSESDREVYGGTAPEIDEDDDGIDDLVAFSTSRKKFRDTTETSAVGTTGKGSRKQLDLERFAQYELDDDIIDSLQQQYKIRRESKKNKKQQHQDELMEEGINKYNLLLKYPYTLHIKDIRDEFESFLHNPARDDLSFPPLDPHGNKTLTNMAKCYNCKSATQGKGIKRYIRVSKYKRTFKYLPDYNRINAILRQRPVFNRTDQKRPKEEYIATDGNATKDRIRQRNKSGHNAYIPEGHIVGGMAPEIDHTNVGRQLLEKLGWVKGEGLGAHGNKGISEPLVATVKKSKTGLGKTKY